MYRLFQMGDSGNCYKVRLLLNQLDIEYERLPTNILVGESRTDEFLAMNPNGRVPLLILPDGRPLAESNAILLMLAEGSALIPADAYDRAVMHQWLFFEQYSHEPFIATNRFWIHIADAADEFADRIALNEPRGYAALGVMESRLIEADFFAGNAYSLADIALYAYTHVAHEGGFSLEAYPRLRDWLDRVRATAARSHNGLNRVTSIALIAPLEAVATNDNAARIGRAVCARGFDVERFDHDAIALEYGEVVARSDDACRPLAPFDHVWLFGFGQASSFLDRMQILRMLDERRFVNHPDALVALHGKISLRAFAGVPSIPAVLSNRPEDLMREVAAGGEWVIKPPAGSFGRDVYVLSEGDRNQRAIVESMTRDGRYALLERHISKDDNVEKRALLAGRSIVGCYAKLPVDHRGNVAAGMVAVETELASSERELLDRTADALNERGVRFAAVDFIAPYVIEVNVANPGFLATYESLTGEDRSPAVISALLDESLSGGT